MPMHQSEFGGRPLLNIGSYARRGPGHRDHISPAGIELIHRTVTRTPEVMVKVLTRGGQNLKAVRAHIAYLHRHGDLEVETDQGERLMGQDVEYMLVEDWDLDVEEYRRRAELRPQKDRAPPKLVHKILFSMPPGSPSKKVLAAVKNFAREEFGLKHRYAMVLHTDEPHPHVHVVVKAVSERGERLNIRKETLRRWRSEFAHQLRQMGVAANATERAVRGAVRPRMSDGLYRIALRGERTRWNGKSDESAKARLRSTRHAVEEGWMHAADLLRGQRPELSKQINRFVSRMDAVRTDRELQQPLNPQRREIVRDAPIR
jgi:relaxase-like protein